MAEAPRRSRSKASVTSGTLGKTRPDGTRPTGASGNVCNDTSFGTTNNRPDKNRFESCSFLMHFAMNPICFAALEGSFAHKIRISYTQKMESYTQTFTRNCKQIQEVSVLGVGNVGYFPKTFFGERKNASFRKLRKATLFGVHNNSIIRDRIGYAYA